MKITNEMINKELRFRGNITKLLFNPSNEEKYIKSSKRNNKLMRRTSRKNVKGLKCTEKWIQRQKDGSKLRIRIYKPINEKENVPGVLWIHGGGYAIGTPEQSGATYKRLIEASNCVIVAPDYRLSVEKPYPAALEDCYDALLWMKDNAKELGIRDDQLMVGGESAGGGLTAALSLYARDNGGVNIAFQMPLYPMIDDRMINESAKDNDAPVWNSNLNKWAWKLYLGDLYKKDVPVYAAAIRATDFKNIPPTCTFVGDLEPFRDETIEYVEKLRNAGVLVDFKMYKGCYHAFDIICPKAEISKEAIAFLMRSFRYAVDNYFAKQDVQVYSEI